MYSAKQKTSESGFRAIVRDRNLLDTETNKDFRLKFAMLHANEMWQTDTMHGPHVMDAIKGEKRKTFLKRYK